MADISIKVRGLEQVKKFIDELPRRVRGVAVEEIAKYLIGNGRRGLKRYPPYKYISRKLAYGKVAKDGAPAGYFSWEQFRYVMWKIHSGEIDPGAPHRTGNYQRGWQLQKTGAQTKIVNPVPYARYVGGDEDQARLNEKVGWRRVSDIISTNYKGAIQAAERAIEKLLKKG